MATDTSKITGAADELSAGLAKGGTAAKTLGAEIANAIKSLDERVVALEAGGTTEPPIEPPTSGAGTITNFSGANGAIFKVGNNNVKADNANKSWSLQSPNNKTLRFELRSKDCWTSTDGAWNDATMNNGAERDEISWSDQQYPMGTTVTMQYKLTLLAGPPITSPWLLMTQVHSTIDGPPPFALEVNKGDRMRIVCRHQARGAGSVTHLELYNDSAALQRGKTYTMKLQLKYDSEGGGFVRVWRDGIQLVNHTGAVGFSGGNNYFKMGIYRGPVPETLTATMSDIDYTSP